MNSNAISVYFHSDVPPYERLAFEGIISRLRERVEVYTVDVNDNHRNVLENPPTGKIWIIARRWRNAIRFLGASKNKSRQISVSALDLDTPRQSIYYELIKKLVGTLPANCKLLVHSPVNYRFFVEMGQMMGDQLRYLPLAAFTDDVQISKRTGEDPFTIGTLTSFTSEAQLNFIVSVAHYVIQKAPGINFRVLGSGPLYGHLNALGRELDLGPRFTVSECLDSEELSALDAFMYCPVRNDHFIPLLESARLALPTVVTEMSGIEEYILDGKTGFVVPVNETKAMAELLLRFIHSPEIRMEMGKRFQEHIRTQFSLSIVAPMFHDALMGQKISEGAMERAA